MGLSLALCIDVMVMPLAELVERLTMSLTLLPALGTLFLLLSCLIWP